MADGKDNNNMDFLDEKKGPKLHVKDVLFIVLRNIHWLILCAAIGAFVAGYWVRHQNHVYQSSARVLIKGSSTSSSSTAAREASVKSMFATRSIYNSDINNEMMIFSSKSAMLEVARALDLNVFYTSKTRIVNRVKDLYGESPIKVDFIDNSEDDYMAFDALIDSPSELTITMDGYEPQKVKVEDTVALPFGRVVVHPTWFMSPSSSGQLLHVEHRSMNAVADYYRAATIVSRDNDFNTIINVVLQDAAPIRAADVINEAIRVYNEDAVKDKKRIIAETYDFINERLRLLQSDLGAQENALANFKRENRLLDLSSYGQSYLATSIQSSEEKDRLNKQLTTARYLIQMNESDETHLIPNNVGVDDEHITQLIANHNALVLELKKYQSQNNPVVRQKMAELRMLKSDMNTLLDVYISVLQERIAEAQIVADMASSKMSHVPQQQLYIENVERVSKIKEDLYLHLLSRREELMISQPSIEPNGKIWVCWCRWPCSSCAACSTPR